MSGPLGDLGAVNCSLFLCGGGAFGCNPQHVSDLFARAVVNEGLGWCRLAYCQKGVGRSAKQHTLRGPHAPARNLYKEIHFAIPAPAWLV